MKMFILRGAVQPPVTCHGRSAGLPLTGPIRVDSHSESSMINPLIPADILSLEPKPKSALIKILTGLGWEKIGDNS